MLQQISVFIENKVGAILAVTSVLSRAELNIRAFSVYDTADFNILRLIVDDPEAVTKTLEEAGFFCKMSEVSGVILKDQPGFLNRILDCLRQENMAVQYMYSLVLRGGQEAVMILHTADDRKTTELLQAKGFELV